MSSSGRQTNSRTRSMQSGVQILLVVAGVALLVAGVALTASGVSIDDAVETAADRLGDSQPTDEGTDGGGGDDGGAVEPQPEDGSDSSESDADGGGGDGGNEDETDGDSETGDQSGDDSDGQDGGGDSSGDNDSSGDDGSNGGDGGDSDESYTLTTDIESEDGDELTDATVTVESASGGSGKTTTGADGSAVFAVDDGGEYTVTANADDYEEATTDVEIDGDDEEVTLELSATGDDENDDGNQNDDGGQSDDSSGGPYTLTTVVEDGDGEALENASVEVEDADGGIFSSFDTDQQNVDDDGEAEFERENGEYTVTANADGYEEATTDVEIDGGDEEITLELEEEN
ncbi:carboxypeptidase regulatory-like domain-containing protein [Halostagnicola kamekurae]|nr:carboxypeptidase regulatory-like domain-containing protein [Halostagnicola kamekurae]